MEYRTTQTIDGWAKDFTRGHSLWRLTPRFVFLGAVLPGLLGCLAAQAAPVITNILLLPGLKIHSEAGITNQISYATRVNPTNWVVLTNLLVTESPYWFADASAPASTSRFYRVTAIKPPTISAPSNTVALPPGTFTMGSPLSERMRVDDEVEHRVTLTKPVFMGKNLVTQGQYLAVVGANPSRYQTNDGAAPITADLTRPVEMVSWSDATNYCALLTKAERLAGRLTTNWVYRLPTEAEWEFACRAGTLSAFSFGGAIHGGMAQFYWYYEYDSALGEIYVATPSLPWLSHPKPVGSYPPNAFGLYDMHGNVWEWCQDWYGAYSVESVVDPQGPSFGSTRVIRGGSWGNDGHRCRSAVREKLVPSDRNSATGFRVVAAPATP